MRPRPKTTTRSLLPIRRSATELSRTRKVAHASETCRQPRPCVDGATHLDLGPMSGPGPANVAETPPTSGNADDAKVAASATEREAPPAAPDAAKRDAAGRNQVRVAEAYFALLDFATTPRTKAGWMLRLFVLLVALVV